MKKKYHLKRIINDCLLVSALILSTSVLKAQNYCSSTPVAVHGNLSVKGAKIVDKNNNAVSFAGNSYFWSNNGWGAEKYYNADVVKWLNDNWGATIIRAAMGVEDSGGYIGNPTDNKNRVKAVVNAAIAEGMYVIIDWHSHHAEDNQAAAIAFFKEMAQTYGNNPNVIYEIYNEPLQVSWSNTIKPYAEAVISEIRKIDPDNLIIVGTPTWSQDVDVAANDPITSSTNIAYTLHFYAATHKESLREKAQTAINKGIALMVTEWGTVEASGNGNVDVASTDAWMSFLATNDISHANWSITDKSEGASLLNPGASATGGWSSSNLTASGTKVKSIIQNWKQYCTVGGSTPTNLAPTVAITSPLNNTSLVSGTAIQIKATAGDSDGTVSQVEFFVNGISIGKDTSSPYAINWTPSAGSYSLTAKATDNASSSTISSAVTVTANATGAANNIVIRAKGVIGDETMDIVVGGVVLGTFKLTTAYADYSVYGSGAVRAVFTNDQGTRDIQVDYAKIDGVTYQAENQLINTGVWQNSTCGGSKSEWLNCSGYIEFATTIVVPTNQAPSVSITSPVNNSNIVVGTAVQIAASASDSDGTISQVEFFVNNVSIGKDTSSPYTISWSPLAGTYSLTAKATDNAGASKISTAITTTITASSGGATGSCVGLPTWTASAVFANPGTQVVYNGKIYKNNWYTSNQNPESNSGQWQVWALTGTCNSAKLVSDNEKLAINSEGENVVKLFPNPSSDTVQLNTGNTDDFSLVSVFDAQGRLMFEKKIKSKEVIELSIRNYLDGIYLVKLSGKKNITKILVKETK